MSASTNAWPVESIGGLFDIGAGKSVTPASRNGNRHHPFLRTSNVFWGRIDTADVDTMHFTPDELEAKSLKSGDLLVCEGGDIGRSAIWAGELGVCAFQNHLHRLRPRHVDTISRFYMYYLQAGFTQLGIYEGAGNKTTIPNLSRSRLADLEVPKPSKPEQEKIAAILWKLQRAIATQDRLIATTRDLKQSAMYRLFTCGLRGEQQKETEVGSMPESWAAVQLGKVSTLSTGTTPATKEAHYYDGDVPFIKTVDVVNNRIVSANTHLSQAAIDDYSLKLFPPGTVLMAMYGQGKTRGQVSLLEIAAATTQNAGAIQPSSEIDSAFLWHYLLSCYERLRGMGSLGHVSHLNLGYLRDLVIVKPPLDEQREIAAILDAIGRKITHHQKKRAALNDLFQTLLHKLMTGEIRVADIDIDTSEITAPQGVAP